MPQEESTPFLETDPPHWAARGLSYILILLFTAALLASALVHIPETVSGSFVLVPMHGTDPVRASDDGIVSEVRVTEGASVRKGDPLFVIQSKLTGDRSAELRTLRMQSKGSGDKLASAHMKYESQRLADEQEEKRLNGHSDYLKRMIELKKKQLQLATDLAENHERLRREGITNQADYTAAQIDADRIALELQQLETENAETQSAVQKLRHESAARLAEYKTLEQSIREQTGGNEIRLNSLEKELVHSSGDEFTVPAPCAGMILGLRVQSPGAVVQNGEPLCQMACSGERLQAEMTVPESGLLRLRTGQGVKLLYDAFPYQRYGVKYGTVRWISPAGVAENDTRVFRVLVDLREGEVSVHGQLRALMPGMGGRAQVVVDKRSLISYAFAPIRQLKSMLENPPEKGTTHEVKP